MTGGALLFSGTDLATVCVVQDLSDFWSSADVRGDLPVYTGTDGAGAARRPVASRVASGQATATGATTAATEDAVAAVKAVLRIGRSQVVTRRKDTGAGNLDTTQNAIVRTVSERWIAPTACTLLFGVETLDGPWFGSTVTIAAVGAVTVLGDSATRAITATLAAGAVNPVITNTTNGYTFRYIGTVPTGGVVVDVLRRTATRSSDSANVSNLLAWGKDDPFQLDPGAQTLTTSSGSASFTYRPAYA